MHSSQDSSHTGGPCVLCCTAAVLHTSTLSWSGALPNQAWSLINCFNLFRWLPVFSCGLCVEICKSIFSDISLERVSKLMVCQSADQLKFGIVHRIIIVGLMNWRLRKCIALVFNASDFVVLLYIFGRVWYIHWHGPQLCIYPCRHSLSHFRISNQSAFCIHRRCYTFNAIVMQLE